MELKSYTLHELVECYINKTNIIVKIYKNYVEYLIAIILEISGSEIRLKILDTNENIKINIDNNPQIFYKLSNFYPFYNAKYGNKYTIEYYQQLYNLNCNYISDDSSEVPIENYSRIKITNLIEVFGNQQIQENEIRNLISLKLNRIIIDDIHNTFGIPIHIIETIKDKLKKNNIEINLDLIIIAAYILKRNIKIYNYDEYEIKINNYIFGALDESIEDIIFYNVYNRIYKLYKK